MLSSIGKNKGRGGRFGRYERKDFRSNRIELEGKGKGHVAKKMAGDKGNRSARVRKTQEIAKVEEGAVGGVARC